MFFGIEWGDKIVDLIISLIQSGVLAIFAIIFTKKTFSAVRNNKSLKEFGITQIRFGGKIPRNKIYKILTKATCVKICYVSGENLFEEYFDLIKKALTRKGAHLKIKLLLCKPHSSFINNIEDIEKTYGFRENDDPNISKLIKNTCSKFKNINNIKIRTGNPLYFFPYLIAYYNKNGRKTKEAYMNFYIPPRKAYDSIFVCATADESVDESCYYYNKRKKQYVLDSQFKNIVVDLEKHFDYVWKMAKRKKKVKCKFHPYLYKHPIK